MWRNESAQNLAIPCNQPAITALTHAQPHCTTTTTIKIAPYPCSGSPCSGCDLCETGNVNTVRTCGTSSDRTTQAQRLANINVQIYDGNAYGKLAIN